MSLPLFCPQTLKINVSQTELIISCSCIPNLLLFLCVRSKEQDCHCLGGLCFKPQHVSFDCPLSCLISCQVLSSQVNPTFSISPIHLLLPMSTALPPSLDPIHSQLYFGSDLLTGLPDFSLYPFPFKSITHTATR